MQRFYLILADAILISHAMIIAFNLFSLPLIWLGHFCKWRFVRDFRFRAIHLLLIGYVALQAVAGVICPLTDWENQLRVKAGENAHYAGSFISHWLQRLIFYEADERIFTIAYVAFLALVMLTLFWVRPNPPQWWRR